MELCLAAVFGLLLGSFCNCTAMRIVRHEDFVHGRSRCRSCSHELGALELVPVLSWVFLRGRCRYCGEKIGFRYPLTELVFSALTVGLYDRFGLTPEGVRDLILAACLFILSLVDLESFQIPDNCLLTGAAAWVAGLPFMGYTLRQTALYLAAGVLCGGAMLLLSLGMDRLLGKESLGGGDIKLFALLGLYLGLLGSYFLVLSACVVGLVLTVVWRRIRKGTNSAKREQAADGPDIPEGAIPFGPAIAAAGYGMLLYGDALAEWYLQLLY